MVKLLSHFEHMYKLMCSLQVSKLNKEISSLESSYDWFKQHAEQTKKRHGKLIFIGNGGSASICSHMATDFSINGKIPAICFNDGSLLTCLGNDCGYENVFVNALKAYAKSNDMLIAISSSGKSPNIVNAANYAAEQGMATLTLSGFNSDNPLRKIGDYNIYTPSSEYGYVEISHLHFCHALLDLMMTEQKDYSNMTDQIARTHVAKRA